MNRIAVINPNTQDFFFSTCGVPEGYREATAEEVLTINETKANEEAKENNNQEALKYLNNTDWMIIRHRDQLTLGIETSLTSEEFQQLLEERQNKRDAVI